MITLSLGYLIIILAMTALVIVVSSDPRPHPGDTSPGPIVASIQRVGWRSYRVAVSAHPWRWDPATAATTADYQRLRRVGLASVRYVRGSGADARKVADAMATGGARVILAIRHAYHA